MLSWIEVIVMLNHNIKYIGINPISTDMICWNGTIINFSVYMHPQEIFMLIIINMLWILFTMNSLARWEWKILWKEVDGTVTIKT